MKLLDVIDLDWTPKVVRQQDNNNMRAEDILLVVTIQQQSVNNVSNVVFRFEHTSVVRLRLMLLIY